MTYYIQNISLVSVLRIFPLVFLSLGIIVGFVQFYIRKGKSAKDLKPMARLLATVIFVVLFDVVSTIALLVIAFTYDMLVRWIPGLEIIMR